MLLQAAAAVIRDLERVQLLSADGNKKSTFSLTGQKATSLPAEN